MNEMIKKVELDLIGIEEKINLIDNKVEVLKSDKQQLVAERKNLNSTITKLKVAKESYDNLNKM